MTWSISSGKTLARCERQWFYSTTYKSWNSKKEPARRRAFVLSKLQSVSALRGTVVDDVLTQKLVPALNRSQLPDSGEILSLCLNVFDRRVAEARRHRLEEFASEVVKLPTDFTVLHDVHYGNGVADDEVDRARGEIERAIANLFSMEEMLDTLVKSRYVVAQRALTYSIGGMAVKAFPDLVAFYDFDPPVVLDWKVHHFANADAARQLASYSLALVKNNAEKPHRDFPKSLSDWAETDVRLWEAQLLVPDLRFHVFDAHQYASLEEYIAAGAHRMAMSIDGRAKASDFSPSDFPAANEPRHCSRCNFKELCWE